jgi:hypothetical protein
MIRRLFARRRPAAFLCVLAGVLAAGCGRQNRALRAVDIFVNGRILTMDEEKPEAGAMAVGGGKILAVGTASEVKKVFPGARTIDLGGKRVMPGIIESHGHLLSLGESFVQLNLEGTPSPEAAVEKVKERLRQTPAGAWITGWGWDEGAWAKKYPTNKALSAAAPDNPVILRGLHGFASWVNKKALEIAGITARTISPPNGEILKDPQTGEPTGILMNKAQELVDKVIPSPGPGEIEKALELAQEECLKNGLTAVHEANTSRPMLEALRRMKSSNKLKIRVYSMIDGTDKQLVDSYLEKGPDIDTDCRLTVRSIKIFVDGALGSHGAAFLEPYSDAANVKGVIVTPEEGLSAITCRALKSGFQVAAHAIGDSANRITLNAFGRAIREVPEVKDHRLRLEHAQVTALEDIPKFAPLGSVVSMQPPHCTSDMPWAETRVGPERIKGAYAWRSFLKTGVHLALNSDFPGETLNPFWGMYAAETRQTPDGKPEGGWYPDQCLTRKETLRAYTVESAYAGFEEKVMGRIKKGMLADFIVLSDDILTMPSRKLLSLRVERTYVGGTPVFNMEH